MTNQQEHHTDRKSATESARLAEAINLCDQKGLSDMTNHHKSRPGDITIIAKNKIHSTRTSKASNWHKGQKTD